MADSLTFDDDGCDYLEPEEIRRIFNEQHIFERAQDGEFKIEIGTDDHLSKRRRRILKVPYCTRSQFLWYLDLVSGVKIAGVHRILLSNGSIGGCGKPDPKYLRYHGRVLRDVT